MPAGRDMAKSNNTMTEILNNIILQSPFSPFCLSLLFKKNLIRVSSHYLILFYVCKTSTLFFFFLLLFLFMTALVFVPAVETQPIDESTRL